MQKQIFSTKELMIFINHLYRDDIRSFTINDPFFNSILFEININQNIIVKVINQYAKKRSPNLEIPDENIFADLLTQSGIISYKNWGWLNNQIQKESRRNPLSGDRILFFSFDTNLFLDRFFTNIENILSQEQYRHIGFVIPEIIKEELKIGNKYSDKDKDFKIIQQFLSQNNFFTKHFINQSKFIDRKRYLGLQELFKIQKLCHCELISTKRGRNHDEQIINTLSKFSKDRNVDIDLFSRDKDFDQMRGFPGLSYKKINRIYPNFIPEQLICDWHKLCQLLYVSSVNFGAIRLILPDNEIINLYGIWSGKGPFHWEKEQIRVESSISALNNAIIDLNIINISEKETRNI